MKKLILMAIVGISVLYSTSMLYAKGESKLIKFEEISRVQN